MESLTCVSYNVKGITGPVKRKKILNQLKTLKCGVAMLQETHLSDKEHLKLKREWVDEVFSASYGEGRKRGVAILINKIVYFTEDKTIKDINGRYVMVVGTIGGIKITFLNLYAPNEDCPNFFKKISLLVADKAEGILVIGGDFNCVLNSYMDRLPIEKRPLSRKTNTALGMMSELGLIDIWRYLHPKEKDFTFMSKPHGSYSRLDLFCISKTDVHRVIECNIEPITLSDHSPVALKLHVGQCNQFKYWRFNVSILNNETHKKEIQQEWENYIKTNDNGSVTPSILWDAAKAVMRGKIISLTSRIKKQRELKRIKIEKEIKRLEYQHKNTGNKNLLEQLKQNRQKLDDLLTHRAEGALRYTNRKYYEFGNRASRLLSFQLRKAQSSRAIPKIKHPYTGITTSQSKEIANAFKDYYKKLYEKDEQLNKEEKIKTFLDSIKLNRLTDEDSGVMVSPITEEEIKKSIGKLKNSKSPGVDGFPGEFYKVFINELTPILCQMYNYALEKGDPPKSWAEAVITVIHKAGKDPTLCTSYRPISLLCQDLKILTSILAARIQTHIRKLVKLDQTGFVSGRHGTDNVRRVLNIQMIAEKRKVPSMLLSLDAEKAFDRLDWTYLNQTLAYMGFHNTFIKWIQIFYQNPKSRVRVNGHCSEFFDLGRGTRQGDAMSPVLFALSIEPLAESIRGNQHIQGITDENGDCQKIALYADDVLLFIENPISSIPAVLDCLEIYESISGYKINSSKSEALMITGVWPVELNNRASFRWSKQGFTYLGVAITPRISQLYQANYDKIINTVKKDLQRWEVLPLSLFGRIETIRMNILPRFLFLFQSLPIWIPVSTFNMLYLDSSGRKDNPE